MKVLLLDGTGVCADELRERLAELGFPEAEVGVGGVGGLKLPESAEAVDLVVGDGCELWRRCGDSLGQMLREAGCATLLLVDPESALKAGAWKWAARSVQLISKPAATPLLASALVYAFEARRQVQALADQLTEYRSRLAERKVIERAKEELAGFVNISEAEAYRRLRKAARDQQKELHAVAENFLTFVEVLNSRVEEPAGAEPAAVGSESRSRVV